MVFNIVNFNRNDIAKKSLDSFKFANHDQNIHVHIIDDCSENDETIKYAFENLTFPKYLLHITQNPKNLGVEKNNITRLNHKIYDNQEFVYLTDNDVLYSSQFMNKLYESQILMRYDTNIFALTLFNLNKGSHFELPISISAESCYINQNYTYKNTFGGVSMLIRVTDFKKAMDYYHSSNYHGHNGWDWAICEYARVNGRTLVSTKNSYVQHIGALGVNSTENQFDVVNNFIY